MLGDFEPFPQRHGMDRQFNFGLPIIRLTLFLVFRTKLKTRAQVAREKSSTRVHKVQ